MTQIVLLAYDIKTVLRDIYNQQELLEYIPTQQAHETLEQYKNQFISFIRTKQGEQFGNAQTFPIDAFCLCFLAGLLDPVSAFCVYELIPYEPITQLDFFLSELTEHSRRLRVLKAVVHRIPRGAKNIIWRTYSQSPPRSWRQLELVRVLIFKGTLYNGRDPPIPWEPRIHRENYFEADGVDLPFSL